MTHIVHAAREAAQQAEEDEYCDTPPKQMVSRKLNPAISNNHDQSPGDPQDCPGCPRAPPMSIPSPAQQASTDGCQQIDACENDSSKHLFTQPANPPPSNHV